MSEIQSVDLGAHLRTPSVHAYVADQIEEASLKVPVFNQLHRLAEVRDRRPFACSTMLISLQRDFALEHYMWVEDAHDVFHRLLGCTVGEEDEGVVLACRVGLGDEESVDEFWRVWDEVFVLAVDGVDGEDGVLPNV